MVIYIRFAWNLVQFMRVQSQVIPHAVLVREFNFQLWNANKQTTEAEEVTDS
jgi:hypothetical protein